MPVMFDVAVFTAVAAREFIVDSFHAFRPHKPHGFAVMDEIARNF